GDGARRKIGETVWIDALDNAVKAAGADDVVVTDVRYPNEAEWVRSIGGIVVKIERPGVDRSGPEHQHLTETNVDLLKADRVIVNDGGLPDFYDEIDHLLTCIAVDESTA